MFTIPANKTDLEKRVVDIRSRRSTTGNPQVQQPQRPTTQLTSAQLPIRSVSEILNQIPNNLIPSAQQQFWNDFLLEKAQQWVSDKFVGRKMEITAKFGSADKSSSKNRKTSEDNTEGIRVSFSILDTVANHLSVSQIGFGGLFPNDQLDFISKQVNGNWYTFSGTIRGIHISGIGINVNGNDPNIPTRLGISLIDCKYTGFQPSVSGAPNSSPTIRRMGQPHSDPNYKRMGQ